MIIRLEKGDREAFLPLLLLADEQEDMVAKYIHRGQLFTLSDPEVRAVCLVTDEGLGVLEIQNLAVLPAYQRRGYGQALVRHVLAYCQGRGTTLRVKTGDSPITLPFYAACGFKEVARDIGYMLRHYDHPILENGRQIVDQVILEQDL